MGYYTGDWICGPGKEQFAIPCELEEAYLTSKI
jgi:hypothetical protein